MAWISFSSLAFSTASRQAWFKRLTRRFMSAAVMAR